MNHRLSVQSMPGQGSCFSIPVPLARAQAAPLPVVMAAPAVAQGHARLIGLRVQVVDHVGLVLSSMVRTLSAWGCRVHAADCLAEARAVVQERQLDLLISDFHLGGQEPDGLMLIDALRVMQAPRPIPALLITGAGSTQLEAEAGRRQAGIFHKPGIPAVLKERALAQLPPSDSESAAAAAT